MLACYINWFNKFEINLSFLFTMNAQFLVTLRTLCKVILTITSFLTMFAFNDICLLFTFLKVSPISFIFHIVNIHNWLAWIFYQIAFLKCLTKPMMFFSLVSKSFHIFFIHDHMRTYPANQVYLSCKFYHSLKNSLFYLLPNRFWRLILTSMN